MTWKSVHLSQAIACDPDTVAAFAGKPENLPRWASGLSSGIRHEGDKWITDSPMGTVEVAFVGPIELGILDHDVTLPNGTVVRNPMRILRNDAGSEVVFSVFQLDGTSDADFERDVALVRADLEKLREVLETGAH